MLLQLENLFDKPTLVVRQEPPPLSSHPSKNPSEPEKAAAPQVFEIVYQKDYLNTSLITNPAAIFEVLEKDQFLSMSEQSQILLLERLEEILYKCPHNTHILSDHHLLSHGRK